MVFTGLIQSVGYAVFDSSTEKIFVRASSFFWSPCVMGDSIAVNGCCLTLLETPKTDTVVFFVMEETREKTNLVDLFTISDNSELEKTLENLLENGSLVNLEKSIKVGDFVGGHVVSGHVDGVFNIVDIIEHSDSSRSLWIDIDSTKNPVIYKGSIAINGVSLTVAELKGDRLRISLIPHTLENTNLKLTKKGDRVNVEFDQKLKYFKQENLQNSFLTEQKIVNDDEFMMRAIKIGELGKTTAAPNPWVGVVIVDSNKNIIGEGFHKKAGQSHAEVNAIENAISNGYKSSLEGAICYTTLEPCSHLGRTGPCDQFLIYHKISRVVIALVDPDIKVSGNGINNLKKAGITVDIGICESEARKSLQAYLHHRITGLPWVVLKIASSLDSKICAADKSSKWITNEKSREDSHKRFRATSQAIIVGSVTAKEDNPELIVRSFPNQTDQSVFIQPLRVVIGSHINLGTKLLDTKKSKTLIFTSHDATIPSEYEQNGVEIIRTQLINGYIDFISVLQNLGSRGVLQVLVEGGAFLASNILKNNQVNQLVLYLAPIVLGNNANSWSQVHTIDSLSQITNKWIFISSSVIENDVCIEYESSFN